MAARVVAAGRCVNVLPVDNPFGYPAPVWQRFRAPARAGAFPAATPGLVTGEAGIRSAQSLLRLQFVFKDGRVADARFRAYGCPTSIAVGAWIAEWAIGRRVDELRRLSVAQLRAELEIGDDRAHCAVMGEDVIRALLAQYQDQS